MNKLRKIQLSIIAVVVAGLIVAAGTYMVVPTFAQETDKTTKETPINKFLSKVASILGIEEETLTSAMEQAKQEIDDETKEDREYCEGYYMKAENDYYKCLNIIPSNSSTKICKKCRWKMAHSKINLKLVTE